jgi:hypothetical protein
VMHTFQKFEFETGDRSYNASSSEGSFVLGFTYFALSYSFITLPLSTVLYACLNM